MRIRPLTTTLAAWAALSTPAAVACMQYDYVVDLWTALESAEVVVVVDVVSLEPTARARALTAARSLLRSSADAVEAIWYDGGLLLDVAASKLPEPASEMVLVAEVRARIVGDAPQRLRLTGELLGRPGQRLVLFLDRRDGALVLPHGSASTLPVAPGEDLEDLRIAVTAGRELIAAGHTGPQAVTDWLVLATALPATRWLAMPRLQQVPHLDPSQLETLEAAFLGEPAQIREIPAWLELLEGLQDPAIDRHAGAAIEAERQSSGSRWEWAAETLLFRLDRWHGPVGSFPFARRAELDLTWRSAVADGWTRPGTPSS